MDRGSARPFVFGLIALAGIAAVLAVLLFPGRLGLSAVSAEELSRVLIVAASPDEHGEVLGQIIAVVDVADGSAAVMAAISPALEVAIPGTSFSTLGDAYPFGGGAGTADAYARASGKQLPYVGLSPEQLRAAVGQIDGVQLDLPTPMSVFDGDRLFSFKEGAQTLDATELQAVLKGAPYLSAADRNDLDAELAGALVRALGNSEVLALPELDTNLDSEALSSLKRALAAAGNAS